MKARVIIYIAGMFVMFTPVTLVAVGFFLSLIVRSKALEFLFQPEAIALSIGFMFVGFLMMRSQEDELRRLKEQEKERTRHE